MDQGETGVDCGGPCEPCPCEPATCSSLGATCGAPADGCGGTLSCGTCGSDYSCVANSCQCTSLSAPTGVAATSGNTQATVNWNAVSGASSYTLKRSTTSGSGYVTVASNVTGTSGVDPGLVNGTTYYYVVIANSSCGASSNSSQTSVVPAGTAADPFIMVSGQVSMEAEHYHSVSANSSTDNWSVSSNASGSGGQVLVCGPDSGNLYATPIETTAPKVTFNIQFNQTGTFYAHMRGDNGGAIYVGDSCWGGIDNVANTSFYDFADNSGVWGWQTKSFTVSTTGVHSFTVWNREDGLALDKIVINRSATPPSGMGPAESGH
jgi:hypothetical protein